MNRFRTRAASGSCGEGRGAPGSRRAMGRGQDLPPATAASFQPSGQNGEFPASSLPLPRGRRRGLANKNLNQFPRLQREVSGVACQISMRMTWVNAHETSEVQAHSQCSRSVSPLLGSAIKHLPSLLLNGSVMFQACPVELPQCVPSTWPPPRPSACPRSGSPTLGESDVELELTNLETMT